MVQQRVGFRDKIELAIQQAPDRSTRVLLKEVLEAISRPSDHGWMREEYRLSPAEFRVMQMIFKGLSRRDIATACGVSPATIGAQTQSIYKKCRVSRTSELMALALNRPHA